MSERDAPLHEWSRGMLVGEVQELETEVEQLRETYNSETRRLLEELARMRRVLQENDMWDEFCHAYAKRYPVNP